MAWFFEMPQASPTMEKGTIVAWRKAEGDALVPQDVIAEIETDKAAMSIEVFDPGFLLRILAPVGAEVPAGRPIAILGTRADEDVGPLIAELSSPAAPAAPAPVPPSAPPPTAPAAGLVAFRWEGHPVDPAILEMPHWKADSSHVRAAPAARRAARAKGLDLAAVAGSGPHGRVLRLDVENSGVTSTHACIQDAPEVIRHSPMRRTIARRLADVWRDAPVFSLTARLECDALVAFRASMREGGVDCSVNDLLVRACALALRDEPAVNASWGEDAMTRHAGVHVGVAVALPDGLITPVVRDADRKGVGSIAAEVRALSERAREKRLDPSEYQGSTFTISNLGMMGVESFTALLNPPEVAILAVGALQREPIVTAEGALAVGWRMRVTLTCDHRAVDGATGARFLAALRRIVEHPALLAR